MIWPFVKPINLLSFYGPKVANLLTTYWKIECPLTSESNDKNKMGDRRIGASSTTHVLQKTAIKFLSGVSKIKITYI